VIYPSAIEPWDVALTGAFDRDPGYDPLSFAIEETHRRGMELHAWVVTIPAFKQAVAKQMGSRGLLKTHPELLRKHADMYYLDPGLPATADYLLRICHEIVSRYDVDGLHFDYIRYPENATSFNDGATFKRYAAKGVGKATWRRDNITRIVRRIYEDVKAVKPWVRISSSPVGKYADVSRFPSRGWNARDAVHQDAEGWLRMGIHDILFPMMYFDGNHFYPFAADWQEQSAGRHVVPGLGIYLLHPHERNWPLSAIERQLHFLRAEGLAGQCYFRSRFLTDNIKGIYDELHNHFYAFPALPPACTWLDCIPPSRPGCPSPGGHSSGSPSPGSPSSGSPSPVPSPVREGSKVTSGVTQSPLPNRGGAGGGASGAATLTWQPSTDNLPGGVRYNVYASNKWPVDTSNPQNLIASLLQEPRFSYDLVYATLAQLHFAVTAIDRCGNESAPLQLTTTSPSPAKITPRSLHLSPSGQLIFE
jgi:uncharacterized lipoprotein YddW (UPF0748 family)